MRVTLIFYAQEAQNVLYNMGTKHPYKNVFSFGNQIAFWGYKADNF